MDNNEKLSTSTATSQTTKASSFKYIAIILFIFLPLIGFYLGMQYQKSLILNRESIESGAPKNEYTELSPTSITYYQLSSQLVDNKWVVYKSNLSLIQSFKYPQDLVNVEYPTEGVGDPVINVTSINNEWDNMPSPPGTLIDGYLCNFGWIYTPFDEWKDNYIKLISIDNILVNNVNGKKIKYKSYDSYIEYLYEFNDKETVFKCTIPVKHTSDYESEIDGMVSTVIFN